MAQTITPELKSWIVTQTEAGCSQAALLQAMCQAGWQENVALDALVVTLHEHLAQHTPQAVAALSAEVRQQAQALVQQQAGVATTTATVVGVGRLPGVTFPQPDLSTSARELDLGDRVVQVWMHLRKPHLAVFGQFLSPQECHALIEAAKPRMHRSLTVETQTGGEAVNADRTSDGMFFRRGENDTIARIEARIARLLQWPVDNGEGIQVLHYRPGAEYKPHYDYFDPDQPGTARIVERGGQRVGTLVMYLNDPARGGGTTFPDIGLEVAPQRGTAVYFGYERPHPSTQTLHGGAPVLEGEKWVATKWLRERAFV